MLSEVSGTRVSQYSAHNLTNTWVLLPVVPADYVSAGHVLVPAGSSSSVPADYVSAGHVLSLERASDKEESHFYTFGGGEEEMACMNLQVQNCPLGCDSKINDLNKLNDNLDRLYNDCYIKVQAYQNAVKTLESQRAWYQNNQLAYEEKIRVLQRDLENTSNELKYSEKINAEIKMEKQDLQAKLDNSLSRFNKWKESSKNLAKLIDNSLSVKSKLEEANDKTLYYQEHVRFVKEGGMNVVPPPITGIFMPSSNQPDIDESKMTYGKKSCESIPAEESLPKPAVIELKQVNMSCNVKGTRYDSSKTKTKVNPVKALAKWVWKPKQAVLEHVSKSSRASKVLTRYDYVDVYGRFKSVLAWDFQKH
ncbi:hypothetical protein Tco_1088956 [Tanacetum coccineum]